jgi:hypothetical protein
MAVINLEILELPCSLRLTEFGYFLAALNQRKQEHSHQVRRLQAELR